MSYQLIKPGVKVTDMKFHISKRIILFMPLALLMFSMLPFESGQTAQATFIDVAHDDVTGLIQESGADDEIALVNLPIESLRLRMARG